MNEYMVCNDGCDVMTIRERLFTLQDISYADFHSRLVPNVPREQIIGVRVPELRKMAKSQEHTEEAALFLQELPHMYYDENMLHGLLISGIKDYTACITAVEAFLPYVDNWAVCDTMSPKVFERHKAQWLIHIRKWMASQHTYTCRFGLNMLMRHFLDDDFKAEYLEDAAAVRSEEYYINMMIAWFFATALAKQWDAAVLYIKESRLDTWVHNKTIQKACESRRITAEQKVCLRAMKR